MIQQGPSDLTLAVSVSPTLFFRKSYYNESWDQKEITLKTKYFNFSRFWQNVPEKGGKAQGMGAKSLDLMGKESPKGQSWAGKAEVALGEDWW